MSIPTGTVVAVHKNHTHALSKKSQPSITLLEGLGVEGDAHAGKTVKHRSRVAKDPSQANSRQVHLIHTELFEELRESGFDIQPGQMGENISTVGIDLLSLPKGTNLKIGKTAKIKITGLRNPCHQLESIQTGLMKAVLETDEQGKLIRKAGIMAIVVHEGIAKSGDKVVIELPPELPYQKLEVV